MSVSRSHYQTAHLIIDRYPFIESRPRFPLDFKALRVMVLRNYPREEVATKNA
jgi:hypothetical protein